MNSLMTESNSPSARVEVIADREFAATVADEIVMTINETLEERNRCAVCLSGGTTPAAVYRLLGLSPRVSDVDWSKVDLFWGDDRFVPNTDPKSNFNLADQTLIQSLPPQSKPNLFPINTDKLSPEESAKEYTARIKKAGYYNELTSDNLLAGRPFDLVLLGMGADGHYASIFPNANIKFNKDNLAVVSNNPEDDTQRITLIPEVLFLATHVFILVSGAAKSEIVNKVFNTNYSKAEELKIPALRAKIHTANVLWFLDTSAASKLND